MLNRRKVIGKFMEKKYGKSPDQYEFVLSNGMELITPNKNKKLARFSFLVLLDGKLLLLAMNAFGKPVDGDFVELKDVISLLVEENKNGYVIKIFIDKTKGLMIKIPFKLYTASVQKDILPIFLEQLNIFHKAIPETF